MRINERICFLNKQMFIECPYASYTGERAVSKTKSLPSPHPSSGSVHSTFVIAVVQLLSHVQLFETPLTAACQASLSFTISQSCSNTSIESVTPPKHLILCHPLLLLPSIFPSIRVFSNSKARNIEQHEQEIYRKWHQLEKA